MTKHRLSSTALKQFLSCSTLQTTSQLPQCVPIGSSMKQVYDIILSRREKQKKKKTVKVSLVLEFFFFGMVWTLLQPAGLRWEVRGRLFHASAEHLIRSNEHNADNECDGKGTNQAFTHACMFLLLRGARCEEDMEEKVSLD